MSVRTVIILLGLVCGSVFVLGALDRRDEHWSRIQCAVFAVASYALAIGAWIALSA